MGLFKKKIKSLSATIAVLVAVLGFSLFGNVGTANAGIIAVPKINGLTSVQVKKYVEEHKTTVYAVVYEQDDSLVTEQRPDSNEYRTYVYFSEADAARAAARIKENLVSQGHDDVEVKIKVFKFKGEGNMSPDFSRRGNDVSASNGNL